MLCAVFKSVCDSACLLCAVFQSVCDCPLAFQSSIQLLRTYECHSVLHHLTLSHDCTPCRVTVVRELDSTDSKGAAELALDSFVASLSDCGRPTSGDWLGEVEGIEKKQPLRSTDEVLLYVHFISVQHCLICFSHAQASTPPSPWSPSACSPKHLLLNRVKRHSRRREGADGAEGALDLCCVSCCFMDPDLHGVCNTFFCPVRWICCVGVQTQDRRKAVCEFTQLTNLTESRGVSLNHTQLSQNIQ